MIANHRQFDPSICELIRVIFARSKSRNKTCISKTRIQKILFSVKEKLPDNNPLKTKLAFYWYMYGPYSEMLVDNIKYMQNQLWITTNSKKMYTFSTERLRQKIIPHNESIEEAANIITSIVKDYNHTESIINEIYENAPYSWYNDYKHFKNNFESYCSYILDKEKRDASNRYTNIDIIKLFRHTLITIPNEVEFEKFSLIYNAFSRMLMPLLKAKNSHEYKDAYDKLRPMTKEIWNVFASIVRIVHHEAYYDQYITSWKKDSQNKLNNLEKSIKNAENILEIPEAIEEFDEDTLKKITAPINPDNVYTPAELLKEIDKITNP